MSFATAYQRIGWAKEQSGDLKRQANAFFASQRYCRVAQIEPKAFHTTDKIRLSGPLPDAITRLTVQAAESLRSALDHAACAVVAAPRRKGTYFPFGDTKKDFDSTLRSKCKHVPNDIKALFGGFKPYKRGNPPLWALNKLCNTHKHRTIVQPTIIIRAARLQEVPLAYSSSVIRPVWNRRKNEIILSRVQGQGTVHHDIEFSLGIAFGKVPFFGGKPVLAGLRVLTRIVERIVMATEAEARRSGVIR